MKKWLSRKLPAVIAAAVILAGLIYGFWPTPTTVDIVSVTEGSFDITVDDDGETRIREKYVVSAPVTGKLARIQLHAGDHVKLGETVLARIEPTDPDLLDARTQAEAEARVRAAEAAREQATARLNHANEELELTHHIYERAQELINTQAISQSEFDRAEHTHRIAQADLRSAEFAVKLGDFELELAKAAFVRTRIDQQDGEHPATLDISAPINGRVLQVFKEDAGVVTPGTALLELGDPSDLEMKIEVLSSDAVRIRPGAKVFVEHWGGDAALNGVVRIVEPAAFLKVSALGVEEKRVNVIADFTDPFESRDTLGDGFRIEARIVVDQAADVVKVPAGVLFRDADQWQVFRVIGSRAQQQAVTVGKSNGLDAEITAGLAVGDKLILHPTDKIKDGVAVVAK